MISKKIKSFIYTQDMHNIVILLENKKREKRISKIYHDTQNPITSFGFNSIASRAL